MFGLNLFEQTVTNSIDGNYEFKKLLTVQNIVVGVSLKATLASPKSQTLSLQFALANMFLGLRSR